MGWGRGSDSSIANDARSNREEAQLSIEPKRPAIRMVFTDQMLAMLMAWSMAVDVIPFACARESASRPAEQGGQHQAGCASPTAIPDRAPVHSLQQLLVLSARELEHIDIAVMNIRCAEGLPGAERLSDQKVLDTLDRWADIAKRETSRHLYRLRDPRYAAHYRRSESYFRAEFLAQVLQEDCGVRYKGDRGGDPIFRDSRELFIHGLVDGRGGTCVSLPALYVAVGRRLGYPLKLVMGAQHLFCRWDGGVGHRFNIEVAGDGFSSFPDEHYQSWPRQLSAAELAEGTYLASLSPPEELAVFLAPRGDCLFDKKRFKESHEAFLAAARLMPQASVWRRQAHLVGSKTSRP